MDTLELIKDAALFGGTVPNERVQEVKEYLKEVKVFMNAQKQVKNLGIGGVVLNEAESEVEFYCDGQENNKDRCESQCLGCAGMQEIYSQ